MKSALIAFLLFASTMLFAHTDDMHPNLKKAWNLHHTNQVDEGINYLEELVQCDTVDDTDKVHYLVALSTMYLSKDQKSGYDFCMMRLEDLCLANGPCDAEMFSHYELSFACPYYKSSR